MTERNSENTDNTDRNLRDRQDLLWHLRLNHASKRYLELATKALKEMKDVKITKDILDCADCKKAIAKRKPCNEKRKKAERSLHRVHSDLLGPISPCA